LPPLFSLAFLLDPASSFSLPIPSPPRSPPPRSERPSLPRSSPKRPSSPSETGQSRISGSVPLHGRAQSSLSIARLFWLSCLPPNLVLTPDSDGFPLRSRQRRGRPLRAVRGRSDHAPGLSRLRGCRAGQAGAVDVRGESRFIFLSLLPIVRSASPSAQRMRFPLFRFPFHGPDSRPLSSNSLCAFASFFSLDGVSRTSSQPGDLEEDLEPLEGRAASASFRSH
jgi:hypothetical protein